MGNGEDRRRRGRSGERGGVGLKGGVGTRAPGEDLDGIIRLQVDEVIDIQDIVRIRILERLGKGRKREIYSVLAEPDRDGLFVKV